MYGINYYAIIINDSMYVVTTNSWWKIVLKFNQNKLTQWERECGIAFRMYMVELISQLLCNKLNTHACMDFHHFPSHHHGRSSENWISNFLKEQEVGKVEWASCKSVHVNFLTWVIRWWWNWKVFRWIKFMILHRF